MQRRRFLRGVAVLGAGGPILAGCRPWLRPNMTPSAPADHERLTIAAIADTFLPATDGAPGARDTGAVHTIVDPGYQVYPYLAQVVADLDDWCLLTHGDRFVELDAETREVALEQRMGLRGTASQSWYKAAYDGMLALTKLSFFGGVTAHVGLNYLAFPGASAGYAAGSAAGAYAATDTPREIGTSTTSTITVTGSGAVSDLRVSGLVAGKQALDVALTVRSPDGRAVTLTTPPPGEANELWFDDVAVAVDGARADGGWQLEVAQASGDAHLQFWSLRVRTDRDDRGDRAGRS